MLMCVMAVMLHVDLHASVVWSTPRHACVRCSDKATRCVWHVWAFWDMAAPVCRPERDATADGGRDRGGRVARAISDHADRCAWSLWGQSGTARSCLVCGVASPLPPGLAKFFFYAGPGDRQQRQRPTPNGTRPGATEARARRECRARGHQTPHRRHNARTQSRNAPEYVLRYHRDRDRGSVCARVRLDNENEKPRCRSCSHGYQR